MPRRKKARDRAAVAARVAANLVKVVLVDKTLVVLRILQKLLKVQQVSVL